MMRRVLFPWCFEDVLPLKRLMWCLLMVFVLEHEDVCRMPVDTQQGCLKRWWKQKSFVPPENLEPFELLRLSSNFKPSFVVFKNVLVCFIG